MINIGLFEGWWRRIRVGLLVLVMVFVSALFFGACETEIEVDLPDYEPKLVIEGTIENGQPAIVTLTRSIPYFADMDMQYIMNNLFIFDATVIVTSSDGECDTLTLPRPPLYMDAPLMIAYVSPTLRGRENTSYTLTVKYYDGKDTAKAVAVTTIPHTFDLDSVWFSYLSEILNKDTMRTVRVLMSDNGAEANYYRFQVKVSCPKFTDRLWVSTVPVAFDDKTFNGITFNYELERYGITMLHTFGMSEAQSQACRRLTFRPGDTVYVKHSLMDYNTYRFMVSGGSEAILGSNPFTNPAPVISNIEGENVLGAWCGFASKIDKIYWEDTVGYYN